MHTVRVRSVYSRTRIFPLLSPPTLPTLPHASTCADIRPLIVTFNLLSGSVEDSWLGYITTFPPFLAAQQSPSATQSRCRSRFISYLHQATLIAPDLHVRNYWDQKLNTSEQGGHGQTCPHRPGSLQQHQACFLCHSRQLCVRSTACPLPGTAVLVYQPNPVERLPATSQSTQRQSHCSSMAPPGVSISMSITPGSLSKTVG